MADVTLRIEVNPDKESEFLNSIINDVGTMSNASYKTNGSSAFVGLGNVNESGREMLSWANGVLRFTADGYLSNDGVSAGKLVSESEPDMFVWGAVPPSGEYSVKLTFKGTENLKDIIVYGDPTANQFPTEAVIDGKTTIYSDDYCWAINLGTESETHTIEFTKWNRSNYNACLTRIMVLMRYFPVDKKSGLKSVESLAQSTSQPDGIYYGVVPSSGSIEIVDVGGEIEDMVKDGVIPPSNVPIQIFVGDKQVQAHISQDSDYSAQSKMLNIQLTNIFEKWDKLTYAGKKLKSNLTLFEMLCYNVDDDSDNTSILKSLGYSNDEIDDMVSEYMMVGNYGNYDNITIGEYLKKVVVPYGYLVKSSYRDAIDKICTIAQLHAYIDDGGLLKFVSARPISNSQKVISVPSKMQSGALQKSLFTKNKIGSVFVETANIVSSYNAIATKSTQIYEIPRDGYTEPIHNFIPILNSRAHNPDITVLGMNIPLEENFSTNYYLTIIKYDITLPKEDIIHDKEFMYDFAITYWTENYGQEETMTFSDKKPQMYSADTSDSAILSSWVNFNSAGEIESIKYDAVDAYFDVIENIKLKINNNGTVTVYQLMYMYVAYSSGEKAGVYNTNSLTLKYRQYNKETISADGEYDIEISNNELLQENTAYSGVKIADIIRNNILEDYANGIAVAESSVVCLDYFDVGGDMVVDWGIGELLKLGDIVQIDKDNLGNSAVNYGSGEPMRFRITGRTFRKRGVPMLDLQLQEVKLI